MKISLIITVLNSSKYIASAIDSFVCQRYENKELIILDGGSTDGSHEIIELYQKKYPKIIKWIKEKDSGISDARNKALKHVGGDLIGFLGADDLLHEDFYEKLAYYLKVNPYFDAVYFDNYAISKSGSTFNASSQVRMTKRNLLRNPPIASGESFYYKKNVFNEFEFNLNNRFSMDYELNLALLSKNKSDGQKYSFFPVSLVAVFNGSFGDSISSSMGLLQRLETVVVQIKYAQNFIEKFKIIYKRKKIILKNLKQFIVIKRIFARRRR